MRTGTKVLTAFGVAVLGVLLILPAGYAGDISKGKALEMVLSAVKAARTVYVKGVMADAKKGGLKGNEDWIKDEHGIMLPAQFVKEIGKEIRSFELGLVGTDPLYASNAAKGDAEKKLLAELAGGKKMASIEDGGKTIAMSADFAIVQGCADCHNGHPKTTKKDWKRGDFMGAIVARMK